MALSTLLGWRRQGYFLPYRYADQLPVATPSYGAIEQLLARHEAQFAQQLAALDAFAVQLQSFNHTQPPSPRWQQSWFPRLDGAIAYGLTRLQRPRLIIEVGSGHSTRFFYRACRDEGLDTELLCIDPAPRADIKALNLTLIPTPVQQTDLALFQRLQPGDMLFIDSSHLLLPGSDVDWLLNRVWPLLATGVLVHFHDILLPDDYPARWRWRGYNEQQGVAPLLTSGAAEPVWASHYVVSRMPVPLQGSFVAGLPMPDEALETSLWLRKTVPAVE
ncbi:class I SAM-dependent methyltransferase [Marinobacterium rhizophilum]|uniref:Class I SAM-dependent methyltransferase n=2 Tax=Marinobacterium rhizophilum TaxID=420402 RepID=A0ABY5HPV7_9GAMM|nr:class I SAM-dependent methyltransferase [Marinobacterium rhizophilum]